MWCLEEKLAPDSVPPARTAGTITAAEALRVLRRLLASIDPRALGAFGPQEGR